MGAKINDQANTNNRGKQGDAWCIDPMKSLIFKVTFLSTTFTLNKNFVLGNINCVHLQLWPLEAAKGICCRPANITEKRKMLSEVLLFPVKDNEFWVG